MNRKRYDSRAAPVVLHTPPRYSPYLGGVERMAQAICERLANANYDTLVLCADEPKGSSSEVNGVSVRRLYAPFRIANTNITPGLPLALFTTKWDVVQTHLPTPWSADWSCVVARILGRRAFIFNHNEILGDGAAKWVAALYRRTIRKLTFKLAERIIVSTQSIRDRLIASTPSLASKIVVIPNGVDADCYRPPDDESGRDGRLLFVGLLDKFHDFKGLDVLLHALAVRAGLRLRVVGAGEALPGYRRLAGELGVLDRVQFAGELLGEDLARAYRTASVFVLPSKTPAHEGMPLAILEALASGMPAVLSLGTGDVAVNAEEAGAAVTVPTGDAERLGTVLVSLIEDKRRCLTMGRAAREFAVKKHSWDIVATQLRAMYEAVPPQRQKDGG